MQRSFIETINTFENGRRQRKRVKVTPPMSDGLFSLEISHQFINKRRIFFFNVW